MTRQADTSNTAISISIRPAAEGDIASIRDIYNHFVTNSTATFATSEESIEERRAWFDAHTMNNLPVLIAQSDSKVVGWASLSFYHQRCAYRQSVELSFYIHHQYLSRGIGKQLTEKLLQSARENDYHCVLSLVCSENVASIALLKKFGFETVGELKEVGRKFDRWLDVIILQKML